MHTLEVDDNIFELDFDGRKIFLNIVTGRAGWNFEAVADSPEPVSTTEPLITQCIFQLTQGCNLSCKHCHNEFYSERKKMCMDIENTREIIDKITEYAEKKRLSNFTVVFHGGESSLCRDTLEFACKYMREQSINYQLSLQTNGLLLHKILPVIKEYNLGVSISIDGTEEMHNGIRVLPSGEGSFRRVFENIQLLRKNEIKPHPLMTLSKYNVPHIEKALEFIFENISYAVSDNLVFKRPELLPVMKDIEIFTDKLVSTVMKYYMVKGYSVLFRSLAVALKHFFTPYRYACSRSPCSAAINSVVIDPEGNVYPCDSTMTEEIMLGSLLESSLGKLLSKPPAKHFRSRNYRNIEPCKD